MMKNFSSSIRELFLRSETCSWYWSTRWISSDTLESVSSWRGNPICCRFRIFSWVLATVRGNLHRQWWWGQAHTSMFTVWATKTLHQTRLVILYVFWFTNTVTQSHASPSIVCNHYEDGHDVSRGGTTCCWILHEALRCTKPVLAAWIMDYAM